MENAKRAVTRPKRPARDNRGKPPSFRTAELADLHADRREARETLAIIDRKLKALRGEVKRHGRFIDGGQIRPAVPAIQRFIGDRTKAVAVLFRIDREISVLESAGSAAGGQRPKAPTREDALYGDFSGPADVR